MLRSLCALALICVCAACSYSTPLKGELGDLPAKGTANMKARGGDFIVISSNGIACRGTYKGTTGELTFSTPVSCSDGKTGNAVITRERGYLSGVLNVKLSNGEAGRLVFGNAI